MSDTLRVLTVRQPWAWAIVHGGKDVENRTRNLAGSYRGPVAIHAAASTSGDRHHRYIEDALASPWWDSTVLRERHGVGPYAESRWLLSAPLDTGAVIGVVDLVDVHAYNAPGGFCHGVGRGGYYNDRHADCSPWAMPDHHHLVIANPRPLASPIPAKGKLGLWRPDTALEAAIWEQVAW